MRTRILLTSLLLASAVLACSGASDDVSVTADAACANYATAICDKVSTCSPPLLQLAFGDKETCLARSKIGCGASLAAPNTAITVSELETCVNVFPSSSCEDIFSRNTPTACRSQAGGLASGAPCGDDNQCSTSYCKKSTSSTCGVCGTKSAAAGACSDDGDCDYGLQCKSQLCVAPGASGASCDDGHPCKFGLACTGGTCMPGLAAGATCQPAKSQCDSSQALACDTATKTCKAVTIAKSGEVCGLVNGSFIACGGGTDCKREGQPSGTCTALAADGATCDIIKGPQCRNPAKCVNGTCKLPDATTCN